MRPAMVDSLRGLIRGQWQANLECRTNTSNGFDGNGTAAGFCHALHDRKAESASGRRLVLLPTKERIERVPGDRRRHADAVVRNAELVRMKQRTTTDFDRRLYSGATVLHGIFAKIP